MEAQSKYDGMNIVQTNVINNEMPTTIKCKKKHSFKGFFCRLAVCGVVLGVLFGFKYSSVPLLQSTSNIVKQIICCDYSAAADSFYELITKENEDK